MQEAETEGCCLATARSKRLTDNDSKMLKTYAQFFLDKLLFWTRSHSLCLQLYPRRFLSPLAFC